MAELALRTRLKIVRSHDHVGSTPTSGTMSYFRVPKISTNKKLLAYVVGLALGDGNLSKPGPRAIRLRISCDNRYPRLIKRITKSLQLLLPDNKIGLVLRRDSNCTDISVYSNHLETLLGWSAVNGSKFVQNVSIPNWIKEENEYKVSCLKGLIETDGSLYTDRGYKMINFTTNILSLSLDFTNMVTSLGFKPHMYKVVRKNSNQQSFYHVRLSKNVSEFLELVKPDKS